MVNVEHGNSTWAHPLVAIAIARWINSDFEVWCDLHIKRLMETGQTSLDSSETVSIASDIKQVVKDYRELNDALFKGIGVEPSIIASIALDMAEEVLPEQARLRQMPIAH